MSIPQAISYKSNINLRLYDKIKPRVAGIPASYEAGIRLISQLSIILMKWGSMVYHKDRKYLKIYSQNIYTCL